jgi:hypothetical protein
MIAAIPASTTTLSVVVHRITRSPRRITAHRPVDRRGPRQSSEHGRRRRLQTVAKLEGTRRWLPYKIWRETGDDHFPEYLRTSLNGLERKPLTCAFSSYSRLNQWADSLDTVEVTGSIPVSPTTRKRRSEALSLTSRGGASGVFGRQMGVDLRALPRVDLPARSELGDRSFHRRQRRDESLLLLSPQRQQRCLPAVRKDVEDPLVGCGNLGSGVLACGFYRWAMPRSGTR